MRPLNPEARPGRTTVSKAELRSRRATKRAARIEQKELSGVTGVKRKVITIHDARGHALYYQRLGVSRFPHNYNDYSDIGIGLSLIPRPKAVALQRKFGKTEANKRLETGCSKLSPEVTAQVGLLCVLGPTKGRTGTSFVSLILNRSSNVAYKKDRGIILAEFGGAPTPLQGHIHFYHNPDQRRAEQVRDDVAEWLVLPATVVLGPAMLFDFKNSQAPVST